MLPISTGKQIAGFLGAIALGYTLSWLSAPGPGTGPVDDFGPTFGQAVPPVIVTPDPREERPADASDTRQSPNALKARTFQPI